MKLEELLLEAKKTKESSRFKALFIAGPPASGKSYISETINFPDASMLDVDKLRMNVAKRLNIDLSNPLMLPLTFRETADETSLFLFDNIIGGTPMVIETTAHSKATFDKRVITLQKLGYDVGIVYTHINPELSKNIETKRREVENRAVDHEFIETTYNEMPVRLAEISNIVGNNNVCYVPRESIAYTTEQKDKIQSFVDTFMFGPINNYYGRKYNTYMNHDSRLNVIDLTDDDAFQLYQLTSSWFDV